MTTESNRRTQPRRPGHAARKQDCFPGRAGKVIRVPRKRKCPHCANSDIAKIQKSRRACYVGSVIHEKRLPKDRRQVRRQLRALPRVHYYYSPPGIKRLRGTTVRTKFPLLDDVSSVELCACRCESFPKSSSAMFSEHVSPSMVGQFVSTMADEYAVYGEDCCWSRIFR